MASKLLQYVSQLKLSTTQLLIGLVSLIVGGLVAALKVQGSELHYYQVKLLEQKYQAKEAAINKIALTDRAAYQKALNEYIAAGGSVK